MLQGNFCFISDQYYIDFPDPNVMINKEAVRGELRSRPCFFCFRDENEPRILWLVPASTKYEKFKAIHDKKKAKYGFCNTIKLGTLIGRPAAFLIQNICPVTEKYIHEIYYDKNHQPIMIEEQLAKEIIRDSRSVLKLVRAGKPVTFTNVLGIYEALKKTL
ncbi:MAG: hypothetical protein IJ493_01405 [Clostridia bacterium]|nr:hypothetical protein [Clostridia bacterium]